mmetsp:Transcript_26890/g.46711  ORF Transcript_26890/g.46711 Transcript_26890/m.46711 type:complete len:109 (+) Transcript_26890:94-420(+)
MTESVSGTISEVPFAGMLLSPPGLSGRALPQEFWGLAARMAARDEIHEARCSSFKFNPEAPVFEFQRDKETPVSSSQGDPASVPSAGSSDAGPVSVPSAGSSDAGSVR